MALSAQIASTPCLVTSQPVLAPGIFGISGIFTNPQFQVVIRALNQKKGVDLMSAPKVTTKSGRKAIVRVAREFPYPTEFSPPEPPPPTTGGTGNVVTPPNGTFVSQGVVTPSTPTAFETRNLGVTLEVEPIIGPDGYTIDLNLSPEVVEFDGFINYGSPIFGPIFNPLTSHRCHRQRSADGECHQPAHFFHAQGHHKCKHLGWSNRGVGGLGS